MMFDIMRRKLSKIDLSFNHGGNDPYMYLLFGCRAYVDDILQLRDILKVQLLAQSAFNEQTGDNVLSMFESYMRTIDPDFKYSDDTITEEMVKEAIEDFDNWEFSLSSYEDLSLGAFRQ